MNRYFSRLTMVAGVWLALLTAGRASSLDAIGVTLLRAVTTNLNGAGITVGQVEAGYESPTNWQVNPGDVGQPPSRFTYFSGNPPYTFISSANTFPNPLGGPSGHANYVGGNFFGMPVGAATNVAHINNYEANAFINHYIAQGNLFPERIVNQSFTYGSYDTNVDQFYDDYAAANKVLFITGAGFNGQPVYSPATCYNGIGVGVYEAFNSPNGPTPDGRSKPDITAPGTPDTVSSYTTPQVAGAAAVLMQAALRGDGGADTNSAADIRTMKALLLNGAVKPPDWTNSAIFPLDAHYGAGVLNVFNSYKQLAGGKNNFVSSTVVATGGAHPPNGAAGTITNLSGWSFAANTNSVYADTANHYYFNVSNSVGRASFALTATLVWNRQLNQGAINNLDLFLYNCANSNLVLASTSRVDNVEHLYLTNLAQGRYDLQVLKQGGSMVSAAEPYALAWEFFSENLNAQKIGANVALAFPVYPAGFTVEATMDLSSPAWTTNSLPPPILTNGLNYIFLDATNPAQFFRLRRP